MFGKWEECGISDRGEKQESDFSEAQVHGSHNISERRVEAFFSAGGEGPLPLCEEYEKCCYILLDKSVEGS